RGPGAASAAGAVRVRPRAPRRRRHVHRARGARRRGARPDRQPRRSHVGAGRRAGREHSRHRLLPGGRIMSEPPKEPVRYVEAKVSLPYHYVAGDVRARYLGALKEKKILGSRCANTGKVFVPPLVASPESFAPCEEMVELSGRGVITTFCIVNIP